MGKAASAAEKGANNLNQILIEINSNTEKSQERLGKALLPTATALARARLEFSRFMEAAAADPGRGFVGRLNSLIKDTSSTLRKRAEEEADASEKSIKARIESLRKEVDKAGWDVELTDRLTVELNEQQVLLKNFQEARKRMREEEQQQIKKMAASAAGITLPEPPIKIEDLRKKIIQLIGEQPKLAKGFTNISREGGDAVEQLGHMFDDFGKKTPLLVKSLAQLQEGIFKTFARQQTADDFENFLNDLRLNTQKVSLQFKALEQEATFRLQNERLKELNATMSAFIDASQRLLAIRQSYNQLASDGVQHEIALQQITAEVMNDQITLTALKFKAAADTALLEENNFKAQEANAKSIHAEEVKRINQKKANDKNEKAASDALLAADKKLAQDRLKINEDYYGKLKELQKSAIDGYKQALLEQKKLLQEQAKASESTSQLLRELDRRQKGPAFTARDILDESEERLFAARSAALRKDFETADHQLSQVKALAAKAESLPGGFRLARDMLEETESIEQSMFAEKRKAAAFAVEAANQEKIASEKRLADQKEIVNFLKKDVTTKIKLQLDPEEAKKPRDQVQADFDKRPINVTVAKPEIPAVAGLPTAEQGPLTTAGAVVSGSSSTAALAADAQVTAARLKEVNDQIKFLQRQLSSGMVFNANVLTPLIGNLKLTEEGVARVQGQLAKLSAEKINLEKVLTPAKPLVAPVIEKPAMVKVQVDPQSVTALTETVAVATTTAVKKGLHDVNAGGFPLKWENVIDPNTGQVIQKAISDSTASGISDGIEKIVDPTTKLVTYRQAVATSTTAGVADGLKTPVPPAAAAAVGTQLDAAAAQNPINIQFNSKPAAEDLAKQVQALLDKTPFNVMLGARWQGTAGQPVPTNAQGGVISGHSPHDTADNILGWLTAGEYVQPVKAVRHYGTAFMESIRKMQFPRFAEGGAVGVSSAHAVSSAEKETTLHLTFQGKSLGKVHGAHDTVRDITKALKELSRGVA